GNGEGVVMIECVSADMGSGGVGEETGVLMTNRMIAFFLDARRANHLAPGRRTMHTLHTFMASDESGLRWIGGSPGGDNQPQVNLQVLTRLLDLCEPPGGAGGAPPRSPVARTEAQGVAPPPPGGERQRGGPP